MTSAKIGCLTYTITLEDKILDSDETLRIGETQWAYARIRLLRSLPDCVLRVTLMHELLHTILGAAGHELAEDATDALAHGLLTFFDDNEELTNALCRGNDPSRTLAGFLCADSAQQ